MEQITIIPIQHGVPCQPENATAFRLDVFEMYVGNYRTESDARNAAVDLIAGVFPSNFSREFIGLFLAQKQVWQEQETKRLAALSADLEDAILQDMDELDNRTIEELEEALWNSPTGAPE